jgi:hypothetical protein
VIDYEKDIEEARRQNLSMVQVMGLLQKTASQVALTNKGYSYAAKPIYELSEQANVAAGDHATMVNQKVSTVCPLCNRTGHRIEDCWFSSEAGKVVEYVCVRVCTSTPTRAYTVVTELSKRRTL